MMEASSKPLRQQFREMPRAIQWAAIAGIGMVLFMLWDMTVRPLADEFNRSADLIEVQANDVRAAQSVTTELRKPEIGELVVGLGPVVQPASEAVRADALNQVINTVLKKHGVTKESFGFRPGKLSKPAMLGGDKRIDRLSADLKFDATPAVAAAIIAELESSPDIESISSVRITKDASGKVKVHITLDTWMISFGNSSATSGGGVL